MCCSISIQSHTQFHSSHLHDTHAHTISETHTSTHTQHTHTYTHPHTHTHTSAPQQPTPAVRAAAFTLFGSLSRFGNGPSEQPFQEQIQTNFVTLLVHLNESDPVVVMVIAFVR